MTIRSLDSGDELLLAEYAARLAAITYGTDGFVEALILSPRPDEHLRVASLKVVPDVGVEGQYPGKQWWRGRRVPGRQISAVNAEVLDALEVAYEIPGDNLIVRGLDLAQYAPGDVLRVGDAFLVVTPHPASSLRQIRAQDQPGEKGCDHRWPAAGHSFGRRPVGHHRCR